MTQEEKQKLLVALCGYLPYNVQSQGFYEEEPDYINQYKHTEKIVGHIDGIDHIGFDDGEIYVTVEGIPCELSDVKLYLRPMESMTKEEEKEYENERDKDTEDSAKAIKSRLKGGKYISSWHHGADWLNKNKFDYRGLIPMGLALPAKEGMYND